MGCADFYVFGDENNINDEDVAVESASYEIREVFDLKEKRKWMDFFRKSYTGGLTPFNPIMFGEYCRFFILVVDGKDAGFIRITNKTDTYEDYYDGEVWCASDAFVKKAYRGQGVLHRLLSYVINYCNVKVARLETERVKAHEKYYYRLGFTYGWEISDSDLMIIVQTDLIDASIMWQKDAVKNGK